MHITGRGPAAAILGLLALASPAASQEGREEIRAFFDRYCLDCHDQETSKGGLSLEPLPATLDGPSWIRVHDRLKAGEMPPPKKRQPPAPESARVTARLSEELTRAALARRDGQGRVLLRRLNRRELEATLHDLLGLSLPLAPILPEDTPVHGFDTVSRGLETSSAHLLRFQRVADVALEAALPRFPLKSTTTRWTGREYLEQRQKVHRKNMDPYMRIDGDALVLHARVYGDNSMQAPRPPVPGRYRVRAAVRPVATDGRPLTVLIGKRVDRFQAEKLMHIIEYRDVPAGKTAILEVETDLKYTQGNQFVFYEALELPFFRDLGGKGGRRKGAKPHPADFSGPGLSIEWAELEGPLEAGIGVKRIFGDLPRRPAMPEGKKLPDNWTSWPATGGEFRRYPLAATSADPRNDAVRLIRDLLPVAFRRPVDDALVARQVKVVHDELDDGATFDEAMRAGVKAVLCSPHFLTYVETPGRLDPHAVAARLARFLWSSLPDAALRAAADDGSLLKPEVLRAQTERMLADARAARFSRGFVDQWLGLDRLLDMKPDDLYVEWDDLLAWSMERETRRFFDEVLAKDLPTSSFLHSDWTFLNVRLARHYSIPGVKGMELRRVSLEPGQRRGGVVTHASVLKLTTNASYTSPIMRGAWMLEKMLGTPPPPPPPNVKAVEPDIRGATTLREQLAKHKNVPLCASCHRHIDPPGFAMENYDVLGRWRERYRVKQGGKGKTYAEVEGHPGKKVWLAKPVEADGETPDGRAFRDLDGYRRILLEDPGRLTSNLAEKLVLYATGAETDFADRAEIDRIVAAAAKRNHGFRSLLHAVIQSPLFLEK